MTEAHAGLTLADPPDDPFLLFGAWFAEADACSEIKYAAAMCLSTVDVDGRPDARTVLLEAHDPSGFVFFTDVESVKGRALARFPEAALTFYWGPLDRQLRIRGGVEPAPARIADECFDRRPHGSQITAWASKQSRELDPDELERRVAAFTGRFPDSEPVPRPPHWRAYRLRPRAIELWQARSHRLHDRLLYERGGDGRWHWSRLYP